MKRAPSFLSKKARTWLNGLIKSYVFESHHEQLAIQAAECLDRIEQARNCIKDQGLIVSTKDGGVKANPAVNIERDNKILFCRIVRELGLDIESNDEYSRLPRQFGQPIRNVK